MFTRNVFSSRLFFFLVRSLSLQVGDSFLLRVFVLEDIYYNYCSEKKDRKKISVNIKV